MDFAEVQTSLNDLPSTFKRTNATFLQFVDALTAALSRLTIAADGITSQLTIADAVDGWLDVWGILFGIARQTNEADSKYYTRIVTTLREGAGPVQVMYDWIAVSWGVNIVITENLPSLGYQLLFPAILSSVQINQVILGLAQVRPAGVPFTAAVANVGTYLDTVDYFDASKVTGSYMGGGTTPVTLTIASATNNSPPLMPQLFLTDPTLNPSLATA